MNKKLINIIMLVIGVLLVIVALFVIRDEELKSVSGVCLGVGAGLFGMSISKMVMAGVEKRNPLVTKQNEIEYTDERNTLIRYRSKAVVADIIQWFIMGIAYITILIKAEIWVTLVVVLVFLLKNVLEIYFMNIYQKEM